MDPESFSSLPWREMGALWSFLFGACIGSFLNVCIYRIPRDLSTVTPRSFCPACNKTIPWYLNIPLFSYVALGGKCAFCKAPISPRYILVEALTGVLFLAVFLKFDLLPDGRVFGLDPITDWRLIPVFWLVMWGLILGTFVDFEHLIIPDRVTYGGIAAGLILSFLLPSLHNMPSPWLSLLWSVVGAALGWTLLWLIAVLGRIAFRQEAMGFGDVKLMGAIGAFMGWKAILFTLMVSSLLGSVAGLAMVVFGCRRLRSKIPYGPYIALAAVLWVLWGPTLWNVYLHLLMPPQTVEIP